MSSSSHRAVVNYQYCFYVKLSGRASAFLPTTASKSAVMGLTKALANEWASLNINVNAIAPGYMATNNTTALRQDSDRMMLFFAAIPGGTLGNLR